MRTKNNNILKMKALGVIRAINICLAKGYKKVSIATDTKYVYNLILNAILDKKGWGFRYIWRQTNTTADFLAKYARVRKESRLDPRFYEDLETLYLKKHMPFGLKNILESEMRVIRIFARSIAGPHQKRDGKASRVPDETNNSNVVTVRDWKIGMMQYLLLAMTWYISSMEIKCFFIQF